MDTSAGRHRSSTLVVVAPELLHTEEVTGSIPVSPTAFTQVRGQIIGLMIWPLDCLTVV
jgi:hypothetical protein